MIYVYVNNARGWIGLNEDCLWVFAYHGSEPRVTVSQHEQWVDYNHLVQASLYVGIIDD